ncbi:hypothetical protein ACFZB6_28765 [Streptomyces syringium]|uniref:hypothetical protein n=1 Tax=Streptomyces syringium TaxID=76729 RepID=UPI0033B0BDAA
MFDRKAEADMRLHSDRMAAELARKRREKEEREKAERERAEKEAAANDSPPPAVEAEKEDDSGNGDSEGQ